MVPIGSEMNQFFAFDGIHGLSVMESILHFFWQQSCESDMKNGVTSSFTNSSKLTFNSIEIYWTNDSAKILDFFKLRFKGTVEVIIKTVTWFEAFSNSNEKA